MQKQKEEALDTQRFDDAIDLRYREVELEARMSELREGWNEATNMPKVTAEDIAEVVAMWTGVPVSRITGEERERLLEMERVMHQRIIGQDEPIKAISRAVRRARAGLKDPKRPIGSFVFLGPTGVGKTLLAKTLAEFLFGSEEALIKLDMSEFMERHNVSRLVGAPPGYVGYEEGGQLTEAVRRRPYSVVLLDEIEKAHPEAFNMLLQIMEDGYSSDAKGRRVDFRNTLLLMTSNIGAKLIQGAKGLGFAITKEDEVQREQEYVTMSAKVMDALKKTFRPEFINRLDGIMVFRSLSRDEIAQIVDLELRPLRMQMSEQDMKLELTDAGPPGRRRRRLRSRIWRPPPAPHHPEPDSGPAERGHAGGEIRGRRHHHGGLSGRAARGRHQRQGVRAGGDRAQAGRGERSRRARGAAPVRDAVLRQSDECMKVRRLQVPDFIHVTRRPCLALRQPGRIIGVGQSISGTNRG